MEIDYNLQRSLGIGCECEQDEIKLAENEIISSIEEIKYNVSQMTEIEKMML